MYIASCTGAAEPHFSASAEESPGISALERRMPLLPKKGQPAEEPLDGLGPE